MEIDLRRREKTELAPSEVPSQAERLLLSHNFFRSFPFDFFFRFSQLWEIDLSHNRLTSLEFLRCFSALGFLDLSWNELPLAALLDLRNATIVQINLQNNPFYETAGQFPLFIPTLLAHCWVINGWFITDSDRAVHREYAATIGYGSVLMRILRREVPEPGHLSASQAAKRLVSDRDLGKEDHPELTSGRGDLVKKMGILSQFDRLSYLSSSFPLVVPAGEFRDYFGVAVAVVAKLWIGESMDTIPHLLCPGYWYILQDDVREMGPFQLLVLLYQIHQKNPMGNEIESALWHAAGIEKYLRTGKTPFLGSTARLIASALIARAIAVSTSSLSRVTTDDLRAYFKFRRSAGFRAFDSSIESVYQEIIAPLWQPDGVIPLRGDPIEIIHPLTAEPVRGRIVTAKHGRVYAIVDNIISHLLASAVFWDGRGYWREAAKREPKTFVPDRELPHTFITAADRLGNGETADDLAATGQSFGAPPLSARVAPVDRTVFLQISRNSLHDHPHRSFLDLHGPERPLMAGWKTFRGIVEPPPPLSERCLRRPRLNPRRAEVVQNVVNVVQGRELGDGHRERRFNVHIQNTITGRSHYAWVTEEEVSAENSARLMAMYREHTARKLNVTKV
jgi:hypothetical protein